MEVDESSRQCKRARFLIGWQGRLEDRQKRGTKEGKQQIASIKHQLNSGVSEPHYRFKYFWFEGKLSYSITLNDYSMVFYEFSVIYKQGSMDYQITLCLKSKFLGGQVILVWWKNEALDIKDIINF